MASLLQKILKKQQTTSRIIASTITKPILSPPPPPPFLNHLQQPPKPNQNNLFPFPGAPTSERSNLSHSLLFYPSFPFGSFLDPVCSTGSVHFEDVEEGDVVGAGGDSQIIWADSVKKKRKRKMNKHKLKKLRKRLRKKT